MKSPLLYPSELSRGQRAGFEPATDSLWLLLSQLSQRCRSRSGPASAYATATPRAPDGTRARTAVAGGSDCVLPLSRRQFMASHRAAACTEAPRRRAGRGRKPAPSRLRVPCHGPAWPGCLGIARCTRVRKVLCERQNENAPGMESEGIRRASEDRGDRSPVEEPVRSGRRLHARTTRAALHRACAATAWGGWRYGGGGSWSKIEALKWIAWIPKGAHLTRVDARVQADFCVGDERSDCLFARFVSEPGVVRGPSQSPR